MRRSSPARGDLATLNGDPASDTRRWVGLRKDAWDRIETQVRDAVQVRDDFVLIPFPRIASTADRPIADAVATYKREAAIVDPRLSREITLAFKATALSDLCDHVREETGIQVQTGSSVADEKVTLFCEKMALREVMRQLSRPFGYTWLRSGAGVTGEYKYELVQDLRSQLLEEELRNRDRNAVLLALDREIERYRPYLSLSPDEALARSKAASPVEKKLLADFAGYGWGPIQIYFRLSPRELASLRAGRKLEFGADPGPGEQPLPPDVARGVLQSLRDSRIQNRDGRFTLGNAESSPDGLAPAAVPEARALVTLRIDPSELGQLMLDGGSGFRLSSAGQTTSPVTNQTLAVGMSPVIRDSKNRSAGPRPTRDPVLRRSVSVRPRHSCSPAPGAGTEAAAGDKTVVEIGSSVAQAKATSADVMEALHRASGLPIVADYYTHLYPLPAVSVRNQPLSTALDQLADVMRLHWNKEGSWLQFRSATFYDDRLKEVPNHLLVRWRDSRRQHGALTLDELIEIAQLSDAQLDSGTVAEGVTECFGLTEWDLARKGAFRPHLRFLANLSPVQRQVAMSAAGLGFSQMSLSQQQQLIVQLGSEFGSLEELAKANLRVEYTQPGWFRREIPEEQGLAPTRALEKTREAALRAAREIDPRAEPSQIAPTELAVTLFYTWGSRQTSGGWLTVRRTLHYTRRSSDRFP